ncbi:MAG: MBL fold metallo-hydrolase [Anaerolineae bacterium]|nr:MBL fold metallo-hydrolase [Anaerolineae bacterium]MDW8172376.1 MBL fold metallo-hydrolase [Anaerolineae bacterium]
MLTVGDIRIILLNDVMTYVDGGGAFGLVPRKLWARVLPPDDDNLVPMCQTCLYVEVGNTRIIVDTGLGDKLDDKQRRFWNVRNDGGLLRGLQVLGVSPSEIDLVIDTHLHADHCSGNTTWVDESHTRVRAVFSNAQYVVQAREYEDAMRPNERTRATYFPINYQPLVETGQMRLLEGDEELAPGVWSMVTPGHTPGHMSVRFTSGGQAAAFVCDLATYAVHFERLGWMTAYDVEPLRTLETKRLWQAWALETNATLIFPHDSVRPVARLVHAGEGVTLEALPIRHLGA